MKIILLILYFVCYSAKLTSTNLHASHSCMNICGKKREICELWQRACFCWSMRTGDKFSTHKSVCRVSSWYSGWNKVLYLNIWGGDMMDFLWLSIFFFPQVNRVYIIWLTQRTSVVCLQIFAESLDGRAWISTKHFLNPANEFVTSGIFLNVTSIQSICN